MSKRRAPDAPPAGRVLRVRGPLEAVQSETASFFVERGWRVAEDSPGHLVLERGSRRRTVLLGALAGSGFHLSAPLTFVAERDAQGAVAGQVTVIGYRWGRTAGRALGGTVGRSRAARAHARTAAALAARFAADGRLVDSRET
ncbi:hypothetical protein [Brachybacterium aquaticum]|uniref:Uncharacterized protein n=1 Tax=Brachybacterium aquaticum TaxID=1432564 RepID=A0A841AAB9_9MICO|nr:hypothetical protein [Brachybacterium aquaticum]MBB5830315.1 hypothetical protein [Brachybacterium aquaticum]